MGIHPDRINDFLFIRNWIRIFLPAALRDNYHNRHRTCMGMV